MALAIKASKGNSLRCFCSKKPLLAKYGVDDRGRAFVHVKVYKQERLYAEILMFGTIKIHCRDCLRWHVIIFDNVPRLRELKYNPREIDPGNP